MRYDLVIFDFDGTLADSTTWMTHILNHMAKKHGFRQVDAAEINELRGRPTRDVMRTLKVSPWRLPFIAADMRRQSAHDASSISPYPGATAVLRELADLGVTLAIVSSNGEPTVRSVLGESQHLIDAYSCEASLFGKARKLRRMAKRFAVALDRTLYVGDETRDIEAAVDAGVAVAAVTWGYNDRGALAAARPTYLVEAFDELADLVTYHPPPRLTVVS